MASSRIVEVVNSLIPAGYLVYCAVRGYRQRRPFWTRESWWRFGIVCALGLLFAGAAISMAAAVDRGIFKTTITSPDGKSLYTFVSMALLLLGAGTIGGALSWFALGDPERSFPGVRTSDVPADVGTA
jgi:hypothetical protein